MIADITDEFNDIRIIFYQKGYINLEDYSLYLVQRMQLYGK